MKKQERIRPLDVDDLTHEGKSKTSINKRVTEERPQNMSEDEQAEFYVRVLHRLEDRDLLILSPFQKNFVIKHKDNIKKFGMFRNYDDTQRFLEEHLELVCEETANYLVVWCIDLEMEEVQERSSSDLSLNEIPVGLETQSDGTRQQSDDDHAIHSGIEQKLEIWSTPMCSTILHQVRIDDASLVDTEERRLVIQDENCRWAVQRRILRRTASLPWSSQNTSEAKSGRCGETVRRGTVTSM